ncbi:hypothetical protein IHE44_0006549 [Lamprotornis superbus]|uniref:C2 domain-containing protein n=1 Tax=Lamprotornis superbus TaxID=245042 RepID=A0A835TSB8_9PASS|nr:hypothetical protein IHE44_0006549 [Lamprotornis superbus]
MRNTPGFRSYPPLCALLPPGTPSRDVLLVSAIITVSLSVTIVFCGICQWCQRKMGKRYKTSLETVGTPDSSRGRSEKKTINDLDRDFWNNNDNTVQQKWSSYPPKEFILNISPYAPYGDPRLSLNFEDSTLSTATTLEYIPTSAGDPKFQRPRTLVRQQSLQQPLSQHQRANHSQPTTSQSLGHLQAHSGSSAAAANSRGSRGGPARQGTAAGSKQRMAGGRSRSNPGSWDHVVGQIRNRGLDMKSFLTGAGSSLAWRSGSSRRAQTCRVSATFQRRSRCHFPPPLSLSIDFSFALHPEPAGTARVPSPPAPAGSLPDAVFSSLFLSLSHCRRGRPGREGRMVVLSLVLGLSEQDDFANIPDLQPAGTQPNQANAQGDKRYERGRGQSRRRRRRGPHPGWRRRRRRRLASLPAGGKAGNAAPAPGQPPHDESDRKTEPHSSVSDLVNSLTSEMLMVGGLAQGSEWRWTRERCAVRKNLANWSSRSAGRVALCQEPSEALSPGSEDDEGHEGVSRENLGRIQFSVGYNFQESTLTVKIMKAQELPAKDFSGTSDPFVKIYLLPDKKHKLETKVKRKNLNPHWNETFLFEGMEWDGLEGIRVGAEPRGTLLGFSSAQATVGDAMGWPSHRGRAGCASHKGDVGEVGADVGINVAAASCAVGCCLSSAWCHQDRKGGTVLELLLISSGFSISCTGFPYEKVVQRVLYLQVLDYDRFSRNDPIGEVSIPLNKVDLTQMQTFWKDLKPCSDGSVRPWTPPIPCRGEGSRGELLLSLCYNPSANSIVVNIIKARNLKAMDIGGTSDPYVKVWLMYKDKRVEKKKTVVMKRCLNPVFNESFAFDIPTERLRETTIVITVMDKDRLSRNDVIGKIYLSWKSGPGEVKHWKDMIARPRQAVAQWHQLKA